MSTAGGRARGWWKPNRDVNSWTLPRPPAKPSCCCTRHSFEATERAARIEGVFLTLVVTFGAMFSHHTQEGRASINSRQQFQVPRDIPCPRYLLSIVSSFDKVVLAQSSQASAKLLLCTLTPWHVAIFP